ncbi:ORF83 [Leucania separata nucleopolyhedrovirus]|uniref:ORF83 n=1 Tax=Leucania separata nucleopolyhedrovirus TaxID=1307956 RepID=Q0IL36_NPVLS|nr:ORF83 [Leucania separata nucleopolyhedrovirus]AAR28847.1 ORF83 [Leucania separata nucleopolyhedrovirus]
MYSSYNNGAAAPARYKGTDINAATVQNLLRTINTMSKRTKRQSATDDTLTKIRSIIGVYRPNLVNRTNLSVTELLIEALANPYGGGGVPNQITHNFNYKYDYNTGAATAAMAAMNTPAQFDAFGHPLPPQPAPVPQPAAAAVPVAPAATPIVPPPASESPRLVQVDDADLIELNTIIDRACAGIDLAGMRALVSMMVKLSDKYLRSNALASALKRLYCLDSRFDDAQRCVNDMDDLLQCINKNTNRNYRDLSQVCEIMTSLYEISKNIYIRMFGLSNELEFDTIDIVEMSSRLIRRVDEVQRFERAYRSIVMATRDMPNIIVAFPDQSLIDTDFDEFHDRFIKFLTTRVIDPKFESYRYNYKDIDELNQTIERQLNDIQDLKVKADRVGHFERERDQLNGVIERLRNDLDKSESRAANDRQEVKRLTELLNDEKQIKLNNEKFLELHQKANEQNVKTLRELQKCEDSIREKNRIIRNLEAECDVQNYESDQNSLLQQQITFLQNTQADNAATITVLTNKLDEYRNQYLQSIVTDHLLNYNGQLQKLSDMRNAIEQYKHETERLQSMLRTQVAENRTLVEKTARSKAREISLQTQLNNAEHQVKLNMETIEKYKYKAGATKKPSDRIAKTGSARSQYYNTRQRARQRKLEKQQRRRRSIELGDTTESSSVDSMSMALAPMSQELVTVPEQIEIQQPQQQPGPYPLAVMRLEESNRIRVIIPWETMNIEPLVAEDMNMQIQTPNPITSVSLVTANTPIDDEPFYRYSLQFEVLQEIFKYRTAIVWVAYNTLQDIVNDRPSKGVARLIRRLGFEQFLNYASKIHPDLIINVDNVISLIRDDYAREMNKPTITVSEQASIMEEELSIINTYINARNINAATMGITQ